MRHVSRVYQLGQVDLDRTLQSTAMAEEVRGAKRQSGVLDEGDASGAGGVGQAKPANKHEEFGHYLGSPAKVRVPAAPLALKSLDV